MVRAGREALAALPHTRLLGCSSLYRSAPVGYAAQPDFINAVCLIETGLAAPGLLQALLATERAHGRVREVPGGPRTLDLDLLLYGAETLHQPGLTLPHPRLHERAFVLYPLLELDPGALIPGRGRAAEFLSACAGQGIERLSGTADQDGWNE